MIELRMDKIGHGSHFAYFLTYRIDISWLILVLELYEKMLKKKVLMHIRYNGLILNRICTKDV